MTTKGKLIAALAWLAPSIVAALAGALVVGIVEARGELDRAWIATAAIAPLAVPVLLIAAVVARGLYAAWVPESLASELSEERGSMPRLAAWVGVVWLGLLGLAWAMFQGTWLLASWTAFKVNAISFLTAILAVLALLVLLALSRPAAELFTIVARRIDRRWQRHAPGSLLRAPVIFLGAAITACGAGYLIWILLVARRLPELSPGSTSGLTSLLGAIAGMLAAAIVHAAWRGPWVARAIGGGLVIVATFAVIVVGSHRLRHEPRTAIALWSESRLVRLGIERSLDLENLRDQLPLDGPPLIDRGLPTGHRDLVLITIDGIRGDRQGGPAPMAALGELARRGLVFEWAFAASPTERRSIPSLVTGIAPHRVRGESSEQGFELDPRHVSVAEKLRAAGYETAAFTCCFADRVKWTWLRGFDHRASDGDPVKLAETARAWVKTRTATQPLLLWIHVAVPWPADRDALAADRRLAAYDQGLQTIDRAITATIAGFAARTVETAPIVIVAGTRGEELGEHGTPFDQDELFNTQLRVPLVIAGPSVRVGRHTEAVSLVDLGPTLIELAGYAAPRGMVSDGISLAPVITGNRSTLGNLAFAAVFPDRGPPRAMAVIRGSHKLIDGNGTLELYDLKADPDERANITSSRVQIVAELRALLTARVRAAQLSPF